MINVVYKSFFILDPITRLLSQWAIYFKLCLPLEKQHNFFEAYVFMANLAIMYFRQSFLDCS